MEAYIYDAIRSPRGRGKPDGALHEVTPVALAAQVLAAIPDRTGIDSAQIGDVILGCVTPVGEQGADIARVAALMAGYHQDVPGVQVNRFCGSGLEAVNIAAAKVIAGEAALAVGGGVESMSRVPMMSDGGALASDPAVAYQTYFVPQGIGADLLATLHGFTRTDCDAFAVESQRRAKRAWDEGRFDRSILPIRDVIGQVLLDRDEHMRPDADLQALGTLKPAFEDMGRKMPGFDATALLRYPTVERIEHVHHAGNSSGIVDGAAALLVGSREAGQRLGLRPRARIRAMGSIGSEPTIMLTGPERIAARLLNRTGMSVADIDLWEINEAFASVVLRTMQALDLDPSRVNVNGGAIAMGHPLGATGAMILGTALDELERTGRQTALICLCVAAGMGTGAIIERV
ncbi:acetyl-CoA C-acetyltransferase [Niveispirillum sp.]|uniref:acetyl-CoA C-acetyltransferase n=1 Tax=Niveispirillum sp. TaxID=1917217 RepID=UPI001B57454B|nr:acetyl-CoA C-acetyltransferase [Niveispirillum sp.]MBP7338659.1 acetyl-CoA C-acetyltransferase [Niveispirillum sp.]